MSCFSGTLFKYFLNYFEVVPVARIIIGITSVLALQMRCISIARYIIIIIIIIMLLLLLFLVTVLFFLALLLNQR